MKGSRRVDTELSSLKSSNCLRAHLTAGLSKPDMVKSEPKTIPQPRRKRACMSPVRDQASFSEDSSDSTGDNWHASQTLNSDQNPSSCCLQELSEDRAYSLRPRKQSRTNSLTARTKAEAAVDNAEQKLLYAAQLVLAVQRSTGKASIAPMPSSAAVKSHAKPLPSSSGASSVKLAGSIAVTGPGLSEPASAGDHKVFPAVGKQLMAASPASGRICLAEVLDMDLCKGQCRLLWQDGSDGWILPQEHGVQWMDGVAAPLHAARPGIAVNKSGQALVGHTLDIYETRFAEFTPALVTAYDHCSDSHTLLSDDLCVRDRCLSSLTFRILEPSVTLKSASKPDQDFLRPRTLLTPPTISGWGSCSNLRLDSFQPLPSEPQSFAEPQQQVSTSSQWSEAQDVSPIQSFCEDALLDNAQLIGPIPDACLLPETADRIQLQSSASAADLCWQDLSVWSSPEETPLSTGFGALPSGRIGPAGYLAESLPQCHLGDLLGDELDLERLWAEDL